ncbi:hypothetical protein [Chryseobacterium culicis]|uniref:YD repeat-containing protein n=1 Tax=Chryseobacterium culicis TaxID=680127 RepID=A0A1H6HLF4_CHRCI|nr:hypothetical protein [Chryseobacterium culicis]SEH35038.1 hypothetical protein SAMN05421593_2856 [Chryseobacterium culicis]
MRKFIISSLAMAVIASCSSSNDEISESNNNNGNDANVPYLLKKRTMVQNGQSSVTEYKYNGTKITESIADNSKTIYTYNGDYIVKTEMYQNGVLKVTREFTYSNGKLMSEKKTDTKLGTLVYTQNYQYLSDNHVKFNDFYSAIYNPTTGTFTDIKFHSREVYFNTNGNIATSNYIDEGATHNVTYVYDTNNHPMKNVTGFVKMAIFDDIDAESNKLGYNNLIDLNGYYTGIDNETHKTNGVHTLNSANYPTKSVITDTNSSFGTYSYTYLYEYNK